MSRPLQVLCNPFRADTSNRAAEGFPRDPGESKGIADVGSLSLEFTRLSQLSGDPKYFDAIQGITDQLVLHQNDTKLPGMWPIKFDPRKLDFTVDATCKKI